MKTFRRLSKSKLGTGILILFLLLILASFAIADISNLRQGTAALAEVADVGQGEARQDQEQEQDQDAGTELGLGQAAKALHGSAVILWDDGRWRL